MPPAPRSLRGIALLVTVGILTLLAVAAVAMVRMAAQLQVRAGVSVDQVSARLLARAGVEYAQARLIQSFTAPTVKTLDNQPDDWTCRDDRDVPLEQALNPSYAQTEPYRDDYPVGGFVSGSPGNGRYDSGNDSYTDRNVNGRFDSWSGRLRSRYAMAGGTFALRVGGDGVGAGLNVNSGMLDNTDINGNKVPDYQDMELERPVSSGGGDTSNHHSRNRRIAFTINQLASLLGMARGAMQSLRVDTTGSLAGNQGVGASQTAGELIVRNRPLGGYRELDEMAKLFPLPGEWDQLRPHISVSGRRNPAAKHWLEPLASGMAGVGGWLVSDNEYFIDVEKTSLETLASLFSRRGWWDAGPISTNSYPLSYIHPEEALKVARFLKEAEFKSWYDLYWSLKQNARTLFLPWNVFGEGPSLKASWVHALSIPDEPIYWASYGPYSTYYSWKTYDDQNYYENGQQGSGAERNGVRGSIDASSYVAWSRDSLSPYDGQAQSVPGSLSVSPSTGLKPSKGSAAQLAFGGLSIFSIESLGRVSAGGARPLASVSSRGEFSQEMTELRVAGMIEARTQDDIENLNFDRKNKSFHNTRRFDGGTVEGRPSRDRVTTTPCYSRDACMELSRDPLLDYPYPPFPTPSGVWPPNRWKGGSGTVFPPTLPEDIFYDFNYCRFSGEVMLADRSWPDPDEILYLPNWDLDQPERPRPDPAAFHWWQRMDDAAQGIPWRQWDYAAAYTPDSLVEKGAASCSAAVWLRGNILRQGRIQDNRTGSGERGGGMTHFDEFFDDGFARYESKRLLLPPGSKDNTVRSGSFAGWGVASTGTYAGGVVNRDRFPTEYVDRVTATKETSIFASPLSFIAASDTPNVVWNNPSPPKRLKDIHFAFTLGDNAFNAYIDGIWHGTDQYAPYVISAGYESAWVRGPDEFRLYRSALEASRIAAQALKGRFWTADGPDYEKIPSFTSPLYRFDHRARLLHVGWDGFVPNDIRDAVDSNGGPTPLRVELMLCRTGVPGESPVVVPLPEDSWKTGGCRAKFKDLWKAVDPGIPPAFKALRYRVWLDASGLDLAWDTPVFDGIEISYKFGRDGSDDE